MRENTLAWSRPSPFCFAAFAREATCEFFVFVDVVVGCIGFEAWQ
jgi:hypothetical protein